MLTATGIVALLFGLVGFVSQAVSVANWPLAQRLGLQEEDASTEPLFRRLERNTAVWDLFTWWTLPVAGVLMLVGHTWWPLLAVLAAGVYVDTAGRELAKLRGLESEGVMTGEPKDARTRLVFFSVGAAIALLTAAQAVAHII